MPLEFGNVTRTGFQRYYCSAAANLLHELHIENVSFSKVDLLHLFAGLITLRFNSTLVVLSLMIAHTSASCLILIV